MSGDDRNGLPCALRVEHDWMSRGRQSVYALPRADVRVFQADGRVLSLVLLEAIGVGFAIVSLHQTALEWPASVGRD